MTRTEVLTSTKFALLMALPMAARLVRLLKSVADSEVLFDGWNLATGQIDDNGVVTLPGAGDIILALQTNGAPAPAPNGSNQQFEYLTPSE